MRALISAAGRGVLPGVSSHGRPREMLLKQKKGPIHSRMAGNSGIMS